MAEGGAPDIHERVKAKIAEAVSGLSGSQDIESLAVTIQRVAATELSKKEEDQILDVSSNRKIIAQ